MATPAKSRHAAVVVLTGGIASGKTAVSDRLADYGIPVIDTDQIARTVVEPGSAGLDAIRQAFGAHLLRADGTLDRVKLREKIFRDTDARRRLEDILHPRIEARARQRINEIENAAYCLLVVPLLVETGLFADADRVVVVDTPEDQQLKRLQQRDGIDEASAQRALSAQASREERLARADEVLDNSGSKADLESQVDRLHEKLLRRYS